ncbi:hypothetical protein MA13_contig00009-0029 [Edwardsiella piscicida]|uniref:Uncharacterized protein n=1 Tax=Edwardsiella anguillarum ET080813 TaxID=667120 RepID=A0A076LLU4_9GAMM|nr:Hypothetical protein ETEE_1204 [Edwardsiella anguillarum ET080813]GAJ68134.1 hypothetical protein MA13_contig00009-0029 [Edwardsiella piscicida]
MFYQQDTLGIGRYDIADPGVTALSICRGIDRIAVHRRFTAGRINADQADQQCSASTPRTVTGYVLAPYNAEGQKMIRH